MPRKGPNDKPVQLNYGGDFSGSGKWVWASSLDKDGNPLPGFNAKNDALTQDEVNAEGLTNAGNAGNFFNDIGSALGIIPKKIDQTAPGANVDTTQADQTRAGMDGLLAQLQQQAATGDGDWQNALKAATARTQATAQAVGQSNPNVDAGAALMNIGNAQAGASQRAAGQENVLRSQSQQAAQGQMADLLGTQGKQDEEQANAVARAKQQVSATQLALIDDAQKKGNDLKSGISQAIPFSDGGRVPGQAQVFGNDEANDTKPALLSPGEIVVDREHAQDPMAAAMRAFQIAMQQNGGAKKMADGGGTGDGTKSYTSDEYGSGNFALSFIAPTIGQSAGYSNLRGKAGAGAPTVGNGGRLDTTNYDQSRANTLGLANALGGPRLSAAPQMTTNAADDAIAAAMNNRSAANATNVSAGVGAQQQGAGGSAAAQAGNEQAHAQGLQGNVLANQRGRDLSMAQAQQQAGWSNTMQNLGLSLANQAQLRGLFSGAGQAMTAASGASGHNDSAWDESGTPFGDTTPMQTTDIDLGSDELSGGGDEVGDTSSAQTHDDPGEFFNGGAIPAYAKGGAVEGRYPHMPQPKDRRGVSIKLGDLTIEPHEETATERGQRKWAEYEEETGDEPNTAKPKAKASTTEKSIAQRLSDFAQRAAGSVSRMAEGGPVPAQPYVTGADLGLGGGFGPGAAFSFPPPDMTTPPIAPPASQMQVTEARRGGVPVSTGLAPEPKMEKSMFPTGQRVNGMPVVEERMGVPLGSVKSFTPDTTPTAPPAEQPRAVATGVRAPPSHALEEGFAQNDVRLGRQMEGEALQQEARNEGVAALEEGKAAENFAREERTAREQARLNTSAAMTRWREAADETARIDTKVDPNRYWAEKTTGQKILGILGLALGAAGTGPDGINKAAHMMNQAIDRDIDAQKASFDAAIKRGQAKTAAAMTYYGMAREAGLDEIAATHAAKAAALDAVALKARKAAAGVKESKAKAAMIGFDGMLAQSAIDKTKEAERWTADFQQKNVAMGIQAAAAGARAQPGATDRLKVADEVNTAAGNILTNVDALKKSIGQYGTQEKITPGVGNDMERRSTEIATEMAKMLDPSTGVRDPEMERWSKLVFSPGFFQRDANAIATLDNLAKAVEERRQNALRVRGLR